MRPIDKRTAQQPPRRAAGISTLTISLLLFLPLMLASAFQSAQAQERTDESQPSAKRKVVIGPSFAWKLIQPLGLREPAGIDTVFENYCRQAIPSAVSDAWVTTGNYGAEGINMIFEDRPAMSDFFFRDAIATWIPSASKMKFYNTRIPMTLLSFNSSGGRETAQERLQGVFSGNINAKAQVGANIDYLYSKGSYADQAAKGLSWGLNGSYLGDRYEFQGFFNQYNNVNKENGGITDMLYITDPAELQGGVSSINAKSIPTKLSNGHTRIRGKQLYLNNRYKIGYWHEEEPEEGDTLVRRTYIPVTSFIYTLDFVSGKHIFHDEEASETAKFFKNTYLTPGLTHDHTEYLSLTNTLGVSLLEGFHKYAKFGLSAYISHEYQKYKQTPDSLDRSDPEALGLSPFPEGIGGIEHSKSRHAVRVGAQLTKQRGSLLTYEATGELGVIGYAAGDVKVDGNVATRFPLFGDSVAIKGYASFHNTAAPYLMNNYLSNHFIWKNKFGKERRLDFGVGVSNLQNHIYFGPDFLPRQHGDNVQVFYARLRQNFRVGILHWDNSITYQATSDDNVIPLPSLAVYSNLYILCRIATLHLQLGVDCDYYTRYYGLAYQPATATFATSREMKVGNYPFCNVYANMKLGKVCFYVLLSHANQGLFGGSNYFSMPYYPLNPRRFQIGLSIDFAN